MAGAISGVGPTQQSVHIDQPLTNISIAYRNEEYIAERVFPNVPVPKQSDKYYVYDREYWTRDEVERRAPGTRPVRGAYKVSNESFLCENWGFAIPVPDELVANADAPLRPLQDATLFVTDKILLKKEILVSDQAFGTTWSSSATPGTLWDVDTSDPIGDVSLANDTVVKAIARLPNVGIIGNGLWRHVKKHPDIIDRIKGAAAPGNPAVLNAAAISALFELSEILVGRAVKNTAAENATVSHSYIWGLHMLVMYRTPTPALTTPNSGYVFQWKPRQVSRFREDQERTDVVDVLEYFDVKITSTLAGYLIKSAASA